MSKQPKMIDLGLTGLDELFSTEQERQDAKKPKVEELPVDKLAEFPGHPFQVRQDEELERLMESVRASGVLTPAIVRPRSDGTFQVISGHRRLMAARLLGLDTLPAVVREMTDDEAVVTMVDANLQREHILPSEKAFAYKMKLEAMNRQGKRPELTSGQLGQKWSRDAMAETTDDSARQIQRFIRLISLVPPLLDMVDQDKIAFNPAVELSYLTEEQQGILLETMAANLCTPSHAQAIQLKKAAQEGTLDSELIQSIMSEEKANQKERLRIPMERVRKFFPANYSTAQMEDEIVKLCEAHYRKRQRDRDTR